MGSGAYRLYGRSGTNEHERLREWSRRRDDVSAAATAEATTAKVLRVREFESVVVAPEDILTQGRLEIYPALHKKGYLEVRVGTEVTQLQAKGHIGVIPINDRLVLEVVPRVPIANLAELLRVSGVSPVALT